MLCDYHHLFDNKIMMIVRKSKRAPLLATFTQTFDSSHKQIFSRDQSAKTVIILVIMKIVMDKTMLLSLLAAPTTVAVATEMPLNHPAADVISKFSHQFRCPYANDWVTKGPKQAAVDLGLLRNVTSFYSPSTTNRNIQSLRGGRNLQDATIAGSCSYTNTWTGQSACLELRGDAWTAESMQARCDLETESTLTAAAPCTLPTNLGGWCSVVGDDGALEVNPLALSGSMDCTQLKNTCETFISGTFEAAAGCGASTSAPASGEDAATSEPTTANTTYPDVSVPSEDVFCTIAPGSLSTCCVHTVDLDDKHGVSTYIGLKRAFDC